MSKRNERKAIVLKKFREAGGNVALACKSTPVSRDTFYRWLKTDKGFLKSKEKIEDEILKQNELEIKKRGLFRKDTRALIYTAERFAGKVKNRQASNELRERFEIQNKRHGKRYG